MNQRWRARCDSYRPAGEVIRTRDYEVAAIAEDAVAKRFVVAHHYAGSYPAARFRFGLYRAGALVGVAVYSHPCSDKVLTSVFPGEALASVELGRFVLLDDVPGNGETWFLARTFTHLRQEGLRGVVSFSDPEPRARADGTSIFPGHIGTIYQASNGVYLGRGTARTLRLLPDGTVFSARAQQKIRSGDRGWRYSTELLERHGASAAPEDLEARLAWYRAWTPRLTRTQRHAGNHRYAWGLHKRVVPVGTRAGYPKRQAA